MKIAQLKNTKTFGVVFISTVFITLITSRILMAGPAWIAKEPFVAVILRMIFIGYLIFLFIVYKSKMNEPTKAYLIVGANSFLFAIIIFSHKKSPVYNLGFLIQTV